MSEDIDMKDSGFSYPFPPYPGQLEFSSTLYDAANSRKLAILESPTGTGKSMAIIAAILKWIIDSEETFRNDLKKLKIDDDNLAESEDWLAVAEQRRELKDKMQDIESVLSWLDESEKRSKEAQVKLANLQSQLKLQQNSSKETSIETLHTVKNDEDFISSDDEESGNDNEFKKDESTEFPAIPQVIYASRTHSQLGQFVEELKRHEITARVVSLGSRQMMCINDQVRSNNSSGWLINDRCAELRKKKGSKGCKFYNQKGMSTLSDALLGEIMDIEDIVSKARSVCACPYYAARRSISRVQVVVVPYPLLFQASARESSGIRLKHSLIVIDEAHNLLEHLGDAHASRIDHKQLDAAQRLLTAYWEKYGTRLSANNARMVRQLLTMVNALCTLITNRLSSEKANSGSVFKVEEFAFKTGAEAINVPALVLWAKSVRIGQKVRSFSSSLFSSFSENVDKKSTKDLDEQANSLFGHASALCQVLSFLEVLGNLPNSKTRVIIESGDAKDEKPTAIHILLLDPASQFGEIVREAHAVVLAGGTMQPVGDLIDQLKSSVPNLEFICRQFPHVIPSDALAVLPVAAGPSGGKLRFTFAARQDSNSLKEAGKALASLTPLIPHGFVVFFPSYDLLYAAVELWKKESIYERLEKKKTIFVEPRKSRVGSDKFLDEYSQAALSPQGAMLFAVIGGKLSEGVNLANDLARGLVVIGMPYPSLASVELQEKLRYLSNLKPLADSVAQNDNETERDRGRRYYTSLCWRAINQTVGRCIRHAGDHAVCYLFDERYATKALKNTLPHWMEPSIVKMGEGIGPAAFGMVISQTANFFKRRRLEKLTKTAEPI